MEENGVEKSASEMGSLPEEIVLTKDEKDFVNNNFKRSKSEKDSTSQILFLPYFRVKGNNTLETLGDSIVKKGLAKFTKKTGFIIDPIPSFYKY